MKLVEPIMEAGEQVVHLVARRCDLAYGCQEGGRSIANRPSARAVNLHRLPPFPSPWSVKGFRIEAS